MCDYYYAALNYSTPENYCNTACTVGRIVSITCVIILASVSDISSHRVNFQLNGCGIACKCVCSNAALTIQRLGITVINRGKKKQKCEQQKVNFHIQFVRQTSHMNRIMQITFCHLKDLKNVKN